MIWNPQNISWLGRIAALKMNFLPRLLNLFLVIPRSKFKELDAMFFRFIWQNKSPRIARKVLLAPRARGGLGFSASITIIEHPNFVFWGNGSRGIPRSTGITWTGLWWDAPSSGTYHGCPGDIRPLPNAYCS